ncbi:Phosphoenolpyruvate/pyruvate domain-containing protein [Ramaria rubella]|nr:Phosphoenolpyruvate/pyruvate domain-containing protein [Ramaria rubella]
MASIITETLSAKAPINVASSVVDSFTDIEAFTEVETPTSVEAPAAEEATPEEVVATDDPITNGITDGDEPIIENGHSTETDTTEKVTEKAEERWGNLLDGPLSLNPATRFRQLLARPGIIAAPGICDGISARCALEAGFEVLYQSGAATTASRLGQPDLAIATLNDFVQAAQMVTSLSPTTPLLADADTGFGGAAMVARTIQQYHRAGVAALHIEDQVQTKRCGHLMGKQVVPVDEFLMRIRAAVAARDAIPGGSHLVIIARTDSAQVLGMEEAVRRLKLAADAGADAAFIEGVKTKELLESTVKALAPTPVLVNVISGGLTPAFTIKEAEEMGAKIIIFSLVSAVAAVHGIRAAMHSLKKTGTDFTSAQGMDPRQFFEVMGLNDIIEFDARVGSTAFAVV